MRHSNRVARIELMNGFEVVHLRFLCVSSASLSVSAVRSIQTETTTHRKRRRETQRKRRVFTSVTCLFNKEGSSAVKHVPEAQGQAPRRPIETQQQCRIRTVPILESSGGGQVQATEEALQNRARTDVRARSRLVRLGAGLQQNAVRVLRFWHCGEKLDARINVEDRV